MKLVVKGKTFEAKTLGPRRYLLDIKDASLIRDAVKELTDRPDLQPVYLQAITGVDEPERGVVELYYLFWCHAIRSTVALRVEVPRENPVITTIADLVPAAAPYEAEVYDLLGVRFEGNKLLREGFLKPEDMKGVYPLRKKR